MKKTIIDKIALCIALIFFIFISGCDEVFPPYSTPENVLVGSMKTIDRDTVVMYYHPQGDFYYTNSAVTLNISVVNVYDDLLQGYASIGERITLQSFGPTPNVIVVPVILGNLLFPSVFQGTIALRPLDTALFQIKWLPIDKNNRPVYIGAPFTQVDSAKVFGPIEFVVDGDIRLFERVQSISLDRYRFSMYFKQYDLE